MRKRVIALVVIGLIQGSLASPNDRLGVNDQKYYKDSISPGIDPLNYPSSHIDYSDLPPSLDPASNSLSLPSLSDHDSQHSPHIRSARNTNDKLADYLKHTTIVAHLVNGIAIQNGLMSGKMMASDVAAELLNFGSIPVSTIANFKKDSVVAVTKKLAETQQKLDPSVTDMEKLALSWNKLILISGGLENVKNLPGSLEYFEEVGNFTSFDFTVFSKPPTAFKKAGTSFTAISAALDSLEEDNDFPDAYSRFVTFHRDFNKAINTTDKYKQDMENISNYARLQKGPDILEPLERFIMAMELRNSFTVNLKSDAQVTKNIEQVLSLVKLSQSAQKEISNMHKLAESRASPGLTNRKHTIGFPNGLNDVNQLIMDVRDPWIGKMINVKGSNQNDLTDGLEPLFNFHKTLSTVDEKLKPISADDIRDALSSLPPLQQELARSTQDSATLVSSLFTNLMKCRNATVLKAEYDPIKTFLEHVKRLATAHKSTEMTLAGIDSTKVREEMNGLISSLGFKNFGDASNAEPEIKAVVEKLKKHDTLKDMKDLLERVKQRFDGIPVNDMKTSADFIVNNQNGINTFIGIDIELRVYACIQKFKSESIIVSQAIKAVLDLKALDLGKTAKVESAAISLVEIASVLSEVASVQDKMKKDAKEASVELNKFPDAEKMSEFIGKSVWSLQNAVKLRDLETQIGQLKSIDGLIQVEILKVSNPADRSIIVKQWGNHKKDMDEFERTLAGINSYVRNLNEGNFRQPGDYGSFLNRLTSIPSVTMNAKEKLKALETLTLSADPKDKPAIEKCQKTLEQLADLYLDFQKHYGSYRNAPRAFKALHKFLEEFLAIGIVSTQTEPQQDSSGVAKEYIIAASICFFALVVGVIGAIYFIKRRKNSEN